MAVEGGPERRRTEARHSTSPSFPRYRAIAIDRERGATASGSGRASASGQRSEVNSRSEASTRQQIKDTYDDRIEGVVAGQVGGGGGARALAHRGCCCCCASSARAALALALIAFFFCCCDSALITLAHSRSSLLVLANDARAPCSLSFSVTITRGSLTARWPGRQTTATAR